MQRVGEFEKIGYDQFYADMKELFGTEDEVIANMYRNIKLPERATSGSAGYDFKAPFDFTLQPGHSIRIPTGIRVRIDDGWWLGCLPRSGLGTKFRMQLDNTMGVIDSDYYYSDNEGHIFFNVTNDSSTFRILSVEAGKGFAQAIFLPYGITYSDAATGVRNGGIGSTDISNGVEKGIENERK